MKLEAVKALIWCVFLCVTIYIYSLLLHSTLAKASITLALACVFLAQHLELCIFLLAVSLLLSPPSFCLSA